MNPIYLKNIRSIADLSQSLYSHANNQLSVVVVSASWCNPCKVLKKEIFNENNVNGGLASYYFNKDVRFFYLDVDENREIIETFFKVNSVPCVFFMTVYLEENELVYKQIDSMAGGNRDTIITKLNNLLEI